MVDPGVQDREVKMDYLEARVYLAIQVHLDWKVVLQQKERLVYRVCILRLF